jgi:hypothetical protein
MEEEFLCKGSGACDPSQFNSVEEFLEFWDKVKLSQPKEESKTITIQGNDYSVIKIGE